VLAIGSIGVVLKWLKNIPAYIPETKLVKTMYMWYYCMLYTALLCVISGISIAGKRERTAHASSRGENGTTTNSSRGPSEESPGTSSS